MIQETHFICNDNACALSSDFVAYGDQLARSVSLLLKHTLRVKVDLVHVDVEGQLIVTNVVMNTSLLHLCTQ